MAVKFLNGLLSSLFQLGTETGPTISSGTGSPETVVTAPIGSLYLRTNGGTGTTIYRKEAGVDNTGWVAAVNGGGVLNGVVTVTPIDGAYSHSETVTAAGVTTARSIFLALDVFLDADENDIEFLEIGAMNGIAGTGQITINMAFLQPTQGPIKMKWSAL